MAPILLVDLVGFGTTASDNQLFITLIESFIIIVLILVLSIIEIKRSWGSG
jgi:hypothetical protein